MRLRHKQLAQLEARAPAPRSPHREQPHVLDIPGWIAEFDRLHRSGALKGEPDFPVALEMLRQEFPRKSPDKLWHACHRPDDFHPDAPADWREIAWSHHNAYGPVHQPLCWLHEMRCRAACGIPSVSAEEYAALVDWFFAHEGEVQEAIAAGRIEDGDPGGAMLPVCFEHLRSLLTWGPRNYDAGATARFVRRLRADLERLKAPQRAKPERRQAAVAEAQP